MVKVAVSIHSHDGFKPLLGNKIGKALILRAESVCSLTAAATVNVFMVGGGGYLFVPASVLEDYKDATNWSSLSAYILPIEGSYWETHHADGSLMEVAA